MRKQFWILSAALAIFAATASATLLYSNDFSNGAADITNWAAETGVTLSVVDDSSGIGSSNALKVLQTTANKETAVYFTETTLTATGQYQYIQFEYTGRFASTNTADDFKMFYGNDANNNTNLTTDSDFFGLSLFLREAANGVLYSYDIPYVLGDVVSNPATTFSPATTGLSNAFFQVTTITYVDTNTVNVDVSINGIDRVNCNVDSTATNNFFTYDCFGTRSGTAGGVMLIDNLRITAGTSIYKYGAKSTNDDTKALIAAGASGTTVWIPDGTYMVTNIIPVKQNTVFSGSHGAVIKATVTTNNSYLLRLDKPCQIKGITVDANQKITTGIIRLNGGVTNVIIDGVEFTDSSFEEIVAEGTYTCVSVPSNTTDWIVRDCTFDNIRQGITVMGKSSGFTIENNVFTNWSTRCISIVSSITSNIPSVPSNFTIIGNCIYSPVKGDPKVPIDINGESASNSLIRNFLIQGNLIDVPIEPYDSSNVSTNNATANNLCVHSASYGLVYSNTIYGGGDVGIELGGSQNVTCSYNHIELNDRVAINAGNWSGTVTSSNLYILNNTIVDCNIDAIPHATNLLGGIRLFNNYNPVVKSNSVTDTRTPALIKYGINLKDSTNVLLNSNSMTNIAQAVYDQGGVTYQ